MVIGFPLTDVNYEQSVTLLRERFSQPYKLINARMQALLNLANVNEICKKIAREHNNVEWTLDDLRGVLLIETKI